MSSSRASPVSAVFSPAPDRLVVTFDEALHTVIPLDIGNWFVRYNNFLYTVDAAGADAWQVTLSLTQAGADVAADVVSFSPPPDDVITSLSGLPVLAFANFPVT